MNRRERRAAEKRTRVATRASGGGVPEIEQVLAAATDHHRRGALDEAERFYRRAFELGAADFKTFCAFSELLLQRGNPSGALGAAVRALTLRETETAKHLFLECLANLRLPTPPQELRPLVLRAISEPWTRPSNLGNLAAGLVKGSPAFAQYLQRVRQAGPKRRTAAELFDREGIAAITKDRLLFRLLVSAPITDLEIEQVLVHARAALLDLAMRVKPSDPEDRPILDSCCALAQQCFINEYVFACAGEESDAAARARGELAAALSAGEEVAPLLLAAVAAYFPLHSVPGAEALLEQSWSRPVEELLVQQVREPLLERKIDEKILPLTRVSHDVSLAVQRQYEENPYPRWVIAAPQSEPISFERFLRAQLPAASIEARVADGGVDYLVAGCGTGQSLLEGARSISGARILAVDISRASLAFAKRKALAAGIGNVEFAQADILELGSAGRQFDVIDCSGVLHHLGDPEAGWQALLSVLKTGGVMQVGLYSEIGRKNIVAAQRFVLERGYPPTLEGIRRCRQEILNLKGTEPVRQVAEMLEFFSTSGLRDLLFHVQEHRFTVPRIKAFLAANGLRFLGFMLPPQVPQRFDSRFADDPARTNLDHWHQFEQENPDTFISMYQFWVQKPRAAPTSTEAHG